MAVVDLHHLLSFIAAKPLPYQSHDPIFVIAAESPSSLKPWPSGIPDPTNHEASIFIIFSPSLLPNPFLTKAITLSFSLLPNLFPHHSHGHRAFWI
ncbi:hypothetical protein SLEP1_g53329 [Rubroshorea leprosula]|uniref:Uncharacterized protein n=1 Tax=Rubroshorea leprosula TaxID=152421 RepID=A0AAV5M9Y5_9ROSI|nr:hypothetical protein SLEP1_g53320 [Rubroshorea leprosula]GKV46342.1 hypothetical protein SLEP1_g53329 [Rubroshorea leprosula]